MTPGEHMEFQKQIGVSTLTVPPGTNDLPLIERLRVFIDVFESGCSNTQLPSYSGKPEDCPECVRAFVDAVKGELVKEPASSVYVKLDLGDLFTLVEVLSQRLRDLSGIMPPDNLICKSTEAVLDKLTAALKSAREGVPHA